MSEAPPSAKPHSLRLTMPVTVLDCEALSSHSAESLRAARRSAFSAAAGVVVQSAQ